MCDKKLSEVLKYNILTVDTKSLNANFSFKQLKIKLN